MLKLGQVLSDTAKNGIRNAATCVHARFFHGPFAQGHIGCEMYRTHNRRVYMTYYALLSVARLYKIANTQWSIHRIYASSRGKNRHRSKRVARSGHVLRLPTQHNVAHQVQLCVVIDCTASMAPYIKESKAVTEKLMCQSSTEFTLEMAVIGYRDFVTNEQRTCADGDLINTLPFTNDLKPGPLMYVADTMLALPDGVELESFMRQANPYGMLGVQWRVATLDEVTRWKAETRARRPTFDGSSWYIVVAE